MWPISIVILHAGSVRRLWGNVLHQISPLPGSFGAFLRGQPLHRVHFAPVREHVRVRVERLRTVRARVQHFAGVLGGHVFPQANVLHEALFAILALFGGLIVDVLHVGSHFVLARKGLFALFTFDHLILLRTVRQSNVSAPVFTGFVPLHTMRTLHFQLVRIFVG